VALSILQVTDQILFSFEFFDEIVLFFDSNFRIKHYYQDLYETTIDGIQSLKFFYKNITK
jgi:hypothetical protein